MGLYGPYRIGGSPGLLILTISLVRADGIRFPVVDLSPVPLSVNQLTQVALTYRTIPPPQ
jgi:hypothetical protein